MMKRRLPVNTLLCSLVTLPIFASADPFVAAGIGYNSIELEDDTYDFATFDSVVLDVSSDDTDSSPWLQLGYKVSPSWGVAMSYNQFEAGASEEVNISALEEEEWEASLDVTEYAIEGIYYYPVNTQFTLSGSVGLAIHDADFSQSHELDIEDGNDVVYSTSGSSETKVGAIVGVGLEYSVYQNLSIVAHTRFSYSDLVSNTALGVGVKYAF